MNLPINGTSALLPNSTTRSTVLLPVYEWALKQGIGFSPVPCHPDFVNSQGKKGKAPSIAANKPIKWTQYKTEQPSIQQCETWSKMVPGLGAILSGEFVVIDIDFSHLEHNPKERLLAIAEMLSALTKRCPKLAETYVQQSGSGGAHLIIKVSGGQHLGTGGTGTYKLMWGGSKVGELKKGFIVLAPSIHESGKAYEAVNGLCDIVTLTLEEFEALGVVTFEPSQSDLPEYTTVVSDTDPQFVILERCLCPTTLDRLEGKGLCGDNSDDVWAVASDAYGWAKWLDEKGISFIGDPENIVARMGDILGYSDDELDRKSEKARKTGKPAADELGRWKRVRSLNREIYESKCPIRLQKEIEPEPTEQVSQKNTYSKPSSILEELKEFDPDEFKRQLANLADAKQCWNKVKSAFPDDVVSAIETQSSESGISSEVYAMVWLTAITADLNGKYKVLVHPKTEWYEPLNLWTVINGESGIGKTIPVKQVTGYLHQLNEYYRDQHKADMEEYESALAAWEKNKKQNGGDALEPKPEEPKVRYASFSKGTLEKLIQVMHSQKNQHQTGLLIAVDEIATLLNSFNKYNSGGDDAAQFLQAWSGSEVSTDTKSGGWVGVNDARLSILGTVQPDVWAQLMKKYSANGSGFEQRWLIVEIDRHKLKKINHGDETVPDYSISAVTINWIDQFKDLPSGKVITYDRETIKIKNEIETWWNNDTAERAKMKSYIHRIAGVLAALTFHDPGKIKDRELMRGLTEHTTPVITKTELLAACNLVKYCMACKDSLMTNAVSSTAEGLVAKAIAIYRKQGKLTASLLSKGNRAAFANSTPAEKTEIINKVKELEGGKITRNAQGSITLSK